MTVSVNDAAAGGTGTDSTSFTISVTDVNEDPGITTPSIADVAEDRASTSIIADIDAFDPENQPVVWSIVGGTGVGTFAIDNTTGEVTIATPLDFESTPTYSLSVRVTDVGGRTNDRTFSVTILDVNEGPQIASGQTVTIPENSPSGTAVSAPIVATDPETDPVTWMIVDPAGLFDIDPALGLITLLNPTLDIETQSTYLVSVTATGTPAAEAVSQSVTIQITDVDEAPMIIGPTAFAVAENSAVATVASAVVDDPENDVVTFSIDGGTGAGLFSIDPTSGDIDLTGTVDHEAQDSYNLIVRVADTATPSLFTTIDIAIAIDDVNEAPSITNGQVFGIAENAPLGTDVFPGPVVAVDPESRALRYEMIDPAGFFAIDPVSGQISVVNPGLDADTTNQYTHTVTVYDETSTPVFSDTATITIDIGDFNEAPVISGPASPPSVPENSPAGTPVTNTLSATDPESDVLQWTIFDDPSGLFAIDPSSGDISLGTSGLDHEGVSEHIIVVRVDDSPSGGTNFDELSITIGVGDVEEAPVFGSTAIGTVLEDTSGGSVVGTLTATDDDGDALTFSLTGGTGSAVFAVDTSGAVQLVGPIDYETTMSYTLDVEVVDDSVSALRDTATLTIDIGPVDEAPTVTPAQTFTIEETAVIGSPVSGGAVLYADPENDTATFSLTDPTSTFVIDGLSGVISSSADLDAETIDTYTVTVTATDGAGNSGSAPVTIVVSDINEAPSIDVANLDIAENQSGASAGFITTTDPELDTVTLSITGGTGLGLFTIDSATGEVTGISAFDHEDADEYTLAIEAVDDGSPIASSSRFILVSVTDINEDPVFAADQAFTISENVPATTPVTPAVIATDPDDGDTIRFELDDPSTTFTINAASGQIALANGPLDRETTDTYPVTIRAYDDPDGGTGLGTISVDITITNVNEAPVFTAPTPPVSMAENLPIGTLVDTAAAIDIDGDSPQFEITGGTGSAVFAIDPTSGAITTTAVLDHETPPGAYTLQLMVRDPGGLTDTLTVPVQVSDTNDAPSIATGQSFSAIDSLAANSPLGVISATDEDTPVQTLSWAITGGTGAGVFSIDSATGLVRVQDVLNWDLAKSYTIDVTVTDDVGADTTETVTINVTSQFGAAPSPFAGGIVLNEVLHTAGPTGDQFIELTNVGGTTIDLDGWSLRDYPTGSPDASGSFDYLFTAANSDPLNQNDILVHWLAGAATPVSSIPTGAVQETFNPNNPALGTDDDLFLYDDQGLLVAYMAWGDSASGTSQIGIRPPIITWSLWDDTHETDLVTGPGQSISLTPNGGAPRESACWEPTTSGDAAVRCGGAPTSVDIDRTPSRITSAGTNNNTTQRLSNLVISEYSIDGIAGDSNDNFVEIYNPTPYAFDLKRFELHLFEDGALRETLTLSDAPGPEFLSPGQHTLIVQDNSDLGVAFDRTFTNNMDKWNYGVQIVDPATGTIIDQVGSTTSTTKEGSGIARSYRIDGRPQSFERYSGDFNGSCIDTDNNAADFHKNVNGITPRSLADAPLGCSDPVYAPGTATGIVISEVQTGSGGDENEFIELFNPSTDGTAFLIVGSSLYEDGELVTILPFVLLLPGEHYLLGGENYAGPSDRTYTKNISSDALLELYDPFGNVMDFVQFGDDAGDLPGTISPNASYQRRNNGCVFTGDEVLDFDWISELSPTQLGPLTPCS